MKIAWRARADVAPISVDVVKDIRIDEIVTQVEAVSIMPDDGKNVPTCKVAPPWLLSGTHWHTLG